MLEFEHEVLAEEGWDCQAFMEACGAALWTCLPKVCQVLMYPLQLLTSSVPLVSILGILATTLKLVTVGKEWTSTVSPPTVSETPAPPTRTKWQHCLSDLEATMPRPDEEGAVRQDITPEEQPYQRQKEGRPLARLLKESHQEAFEKDSDLTQVTRLAYFKMHHPVMTTKNPTTSPTPSGRWPLQLASWVLISSRSRRCGLDERTSGLLTTWWKVPQSTSTSFRWCLPPNCLRSWA